MKYFIRNSLILMFLVFAATYMSEFSLHSEKNHGNVKVTKE